MDEQLHRRSIRAISYRRIGSMPGCIFTKSADVGEATLPDGSVVTITWGRNCGRAEAAWYIENGHVTVVCGADDGSCEVVIPDNIARQMRSVVTP